MDEGTIFVVGLITFVLGQLFALLLADRQAEHQLKRDREAREEARRDRSRELQRVTLLELQEALAVYGTAVVETDAACKRLSIVSGKWVVDLDSIKDEQKAALQVSKLVNRLKDDQLGPLWNAANNHVVSMLKTKASKDSDLAYLDFLEKWQSLHDRLRPLLQEHL